MAVARVLLVDDDEVVRFSLGRVLEKNGFRVTTAASVSEALKHIGAATFDVLLSDLHMPGAGDGLTVVSAMRHANPQAVTLLLSGFPQMQAAAEAILRQTDEVLVKPMEIDALIEVIMQRLKMERPPAPRIESVATILERTLAGTIESWIERVHSDASVMKVVMSDEERSQHLPQVFADLVHSLRSSHPIGGRENPSPAAAAHGLLRRKQGYTAAMMVEESRMLQVSIFETLQKNLTSIDFSILLQGVMAIADEIDSQLSQAMTCYTVEALVEATA